jgi:hypothetical protein
VLPADIESPPRVIEVKAFGTSTRGYDLPLEVRQLDEAPTTAQLRARALALPRTPRGILI